MMTWVRSVGAELGRLKWAIVAAVVPLLLLDVAGLRFDLIGELRWVPILQKLSTISLALILAHLSWQATFPYLSLSAMAREARDASEKGLVLGAAVWAVQMLGVCLLRGLYYAAVILGFSMGI